MFEWYGSERKTVPCQFGYPWVWTNHELLSVIGVHVGHSLVKKVQKKKKDKRKRKVVWGVRGPVKASLPSFNQFLFCFVFLFLFLTFFSSGNVAAGVFLFSITELQSAHAKQSFILYIHSSLKLRAIHTTSTYVATVASSIRGQTIFRKFNILLALSYWFCFFFHFFWHI